jgi:PmbA protein
MNAPARDHGQDRLERRADVGLGVEKRLLDLCADVVERATKRGASGCEAYAEHVVQVGANVEQNALKGCARQEHEAIGIRVLLRGDGHARDGGERVGFAYVNETSARSLDAAIDDALAIARASPGDPANGLVAPLPLKHVAGLWDDAVAALGPDDVVRQATEMLEIARGVDGRVSVDNGSFDATAACAAVVSSAGVRAAASETAASWSLFGMAIDGDEVGSFDHLGAASRRVDGIDTASLARTYAERVIAVLHPRDGASYRGRVLFSPDAFEEIFLEAVLDAIDGDAVHKGKSRLKDKLGERVGASGLLIVDDGTLSGAIGSSSFDREGLPHRRTVIVGDGVLHTFLYDGKSAKRAGRRPTGHAQGSARSLPGVGTTNVTVGPGDLDHRTLLRELGTGILVGRFSGNVDAVSGDFSGVVKNSFWVERGEIAYPIKETLVAGNAFDALHRVLARGRELHRNMTTLCPYVLVDGLDVTAAA